MPPPEGAVLLIGAGRMGGALLKGWTAATTSSSILVVEPEPSEAIRALAEAGAVTLWPKLEPETLPRLSAMVLAIKPQVLRADAALLKALGRTGALIVSIAAGITTAFLAAGLANGGRIVRAMPNTPGAVGRGITALYAPPQVDEADRRLAEALMASLGETLWVADESLMDAVTAVSGSGPAYVFLLAEALAEAGRAEGLPPATAERLARATVAGAGALMSADGRPAGELRRDVTSPGGTTEAALRVLLAEDGLGALLRKAVAAAAARARELGKS